MLEPLKRLYRRFSVRAHVARLECAINSTREKISTLHEEDRSRINELWTQLTETRQAVEKLTAGMERLRKESGDSAVQLSRAGTIDTWQVIDAVDALRFPPETDVRCGICGYHAPKRTFATMISQCRFGGGRLERFVCPECGCIFGPLKMSLMTQSELEQDYCRCYMAYHWNISRQELVTAESTVTDPNKVYLNYGSGADPENGTAAVMRRKGYQVYAYEPYAAGGKNLPDWLITSEERLRGMRFDAIYSNDLLEHLQDPAQTLLFMKSLLKDGDSFMEHSTSCYEYRQEFTRFHLFFFTGRSLDVLCRRTGLRSELIANTDRVEKNHQYISYRFYPETGEAGRNAPIHV